MKPGRMLRHKSKLSAALLALVAGMGGGAAVAEQVYLEHERYGAWEMSLQYARVGSARIDEVFEAPLDADSGSGWGLSVGYNLNNHWLISMQFVGATQDYLTTDGSQNLEHELDLTSTLISGTWHLRPGGITPYVTLGAGWTNVDSNIRSDTPHSDCWWDPWWGYSCSTHYPTYNDSTTSISAAAGMRWDFHTQGFARVSYGKLWLDSGNSDSASPTLMRLEIGIRR